MNSNDSNIWLCPLCQTPIDDKPSMGTWGVPFSPPHRLYEYCEMPMHYECLETWEDRAEFSLGYFHQFLGTDRLRNGYLLAQTDNWALMCGMYERIKKPREAYKEGEYMPNDDQFKVGRIGPSYAQVLITDWPIRLQGSFNGWTAYANGGFRGKLVGGALSAAEKVMSEVRQIAPDLSALEKLLEKLEAK